MIARSTTPPQPIPFATGLSWPKPASRPLPDPMIDPRLAQGFALHATAQARPQAPVSWAHTAANAAANTPSANSSHRQAPQKADHASEPDRPNHRAAAAWPAPKERPARQALARYDGPHSLSVRSAASGRHYRFEHQGVTQVIDAMDIALMRRIEDITLL